MGSHQADAIIDHTHNAIVLVYPQPGSRRLRHRLDHLPLARYHFQRPSHVLSLRRRSLPQHSREVGGSITTRSRGRWSGKVWRSFRRLYSASDGQGESFCKDLHAQAGPVSGLHRRLHARSSQATCRMGDAAALGVTPPSIHQMVLALERAGLIGRQPGSPHSIEVLVPPDQLPVLEISDQPVKTSVSRY
ncbi:hypothetical protein ACVIM8_005679 [Bradyrhizobium sp. USDA 4529]